MKIKDIARQLHRPVEEIERITKVSDICRGGFCDPDEIEFIKNVDGRKKQILMKQMVFIIEKHPFIDELALAKKVFRPLSYSRWLLPYLTEDYDNLAETDDGLLFFVNESTLKFLLSRDIIDLETFYYFSENP